MDLTRTTTITPCGGPTSFAAATRAKRTAEPAPEITARNRASAMSSSALLRHFAHALWSAKIQPSPGPTLPGLGGECELLWNRLATLSCPSDSEPVALGLTTSATGCSCSLSYPTPTASDWKGGKRKRKAGSQANLRDEFTQRTGLLYLHPADCEAAMGFPTMWTELRPSETPSTPTLPSGSGGES